MKIPKWIREIECFSKIKSCLILEGNIYDEYPMFNDEKQIATIFMIKYICI